MRPPESACGQACPSGSEGHHNRGFYPSLAALGCRVSSPIWLITRATEIGLEPRVAGRDEALVGGVQWRVVQHPRPVLDHLDAAVEGAVIDHVEGDVRVSVVDPFGARGTGDHREHPDPETIDESGSQ